VSVRPTTSLAPPKCLRQNRWLITATRPSGPPDTFDEAHTQRVAILLFDLIEAAELEARPANRLGTREPASDVRCDLPIEVKPELLVNLAFHLRAPEHPPRAAIF
jgi:hypothetical protein